MSRNAAVEVKPMHSRLEAALGGKTYRWIAKSTGIHPETVRRYMQGQSPSVEFISSVCKHLDVNPQWLLTGEGPMQRDDVRAHHLAQADPSELMAAVAATLDTLSERVDRLELFVQRLETRVSVIGAADGEPGTASFAEARPQSGPESRSQIGDQNRSEYRPVSSAQQRLAGPAERIGRAVAKRPSADADRVDETDRA